LKPERTALREAGPADDLGGPCAFWASNYAVSRKRPAGRSAKAGNEVRPFSPSAAPETPPFLSLSPKAGNFPESVPSFSVTAAQELTTTRFSEVRVTLGVSGVTRPEIERLRVPGCGVRGESI